VFLRFLTLAFQWSHFGVFLKSPAMRRATELSAHTKGHNLYQRGETNAT
jgi:hypothetical protein